MRLSVVRRIILLLALAPPAVSSGSDAVDPLPSYNLSPFVQIYGLPALDVARVLPRGGMQAQVTFETGNHFLSQSSQADFILLDGETYRTTVTLKYGTRTAEWGIELPYISHSGGFLDSLIEGWHDFFGLPPARRDQTPANRSIYLYQRNGIDQFRLTGSVRGVGDIRLLAAWPLWRDTATDLALRTSLKLPTGAASELLGSGAADVAVWLAAGCAHGRCPTRWGWNATAGILALGRGDVLPDQQRSLATFGGVGAGWHATDSITLKAELRAHSAFYRRTDLAPLGKTAAYLILGGTWNVYRETVLEVGVAEDIRVDTAPDVSLMVGLRTNF